MALVNERKVIFLGHGSSGKTWVIRHLLQGAAHVEGYADREFPRGISLYTREYTTDMGKTRIHFWDFGSAASFRYLHPIFMTDRTVYVVMINAREGNEHDTARRWLRDIQRYAEGCPVLLVLNSAEQSLNTGVDQFLLRKECPGLRDALVVSKAEELESKILHPLLKIIGSTSVADRPIPETWEQLISELRGMDKNEIRRGEFDRLCGERVPSSQRKELLMLCRDLGVCVWHDSGRLREHIILRQEWLVNALNAVLEESDDRKGNGVIHRDGLCSILAQGETGKSGIKRILEGISYSWDDASLIIDIMRHFSMLYELAAEKLFLPGLCRGQMPLEAEADIADPRVLEVAVSNLPLPERLLYGLMTRMRADLPPGGIWEEGIRFHREREHVSMVVRLVDDGLRIYIRSRDWRRNVFEYLDRILNEIASLAEDYDLNCSEIQVDMIYRAVNRPVAYEELCMMPEDGLLYIRGVGKITYRDIRRSVGAKQPVLDHEDETLIRDLLVACGNLQDNPKYQTNVDDRVLEDDRNRYVKDSMNHPRAPYKVLDQSQRGDTPGGKRFGELDLLVEREDNSTWTVIEALNVKRGYSDKTKWDQHLFKLLHHYDKQGQPFAVLLAYTECEREEWGPLWKKYYGHMETHCPEGGRNGQEDPNRIRYELVIDSCEEYLPEGVAHTHYKKLARCIYEIGGQQTCVIHIFIRLKTVGENNAGEEENHG